METVQQILEPQQDSIIQLAKLTAKLEGDNKAEATASLEGLRKAEELLRNRLYILQIWRKFDYETANKLHKKKNGKYNDPDLEKILEDRDKREEKNKRERERARSVTPNKPKKFRFGDSPYYSRGGPFRAQSYDRQSGSGYRGGARPNFNQREPRADLKCHICGESGHLFKDCTRKK